MNFAKATIPRITEEKARQEKEVERKRNTELREQLLETLYTESQPVTFDSLQQNVMAVAVLTAEPMEVSTKAQVGPVKLFCNFFMRTSRQLDKQGLIWEES